MQYNHHKEGKVKEQCLQIYSIMRWEGKETFRKMALLGVFRQPF
jgi:hypothetical protein